VWIRYYDKDGKWLGGHNLHGKGIRFEINTETSVVVKKSKYDIRNAVTTKITLSDKGTVNPYWYPTTMDVLTDDFTWRKRAYLDKWIKPGEWQEFPLQGAQFIDLEDADDDEEPKLK